VGALVVGLLVGPIVGPLVGGNVGGNVGLLVGPLVGLAVGAGVGGNDTSLGSFLQKSYSSLSGNCPSASSVWVLPLTLLVRRR